jgi:hypothetical protein
MFGMPNAENALKGSPFEVFLFLERARKPEGARVGRFCVLGEGRGRVGGGGKISKGKVLARC